MTAKEKAEELVKKFRKYVDGEIDGENGFCYSKERETYNAKQCALIAVDEIFLVLPDIQEVWDFWGQVKKEIESM